MRQVSASAYRYAKALFDLATEGKSRAGVSADLAALAAALREVPALMKTLSSPLVSASQKADFLKSIAEKYRFSADTSRFLQLLAHKSRAGLLEEVLRCYGELEAEANGIIEARLRVAQPLSKAQRKELETLLLQKVPGAKSVLFHEEEDTTLLGGFVVQMASQEIDASVRGRLNRLRQRLKTF